jgi:hypothetical protein
MVAWVPRKSTEAARHGTALTVERLLKRVVDDMHAGDSNDYLY